MLPNSVPAVDVMDGGKRVFLKIIYLLLVFNSANFKKKMFKIQIKKLVGVERCVGSPATHIRVTLIDN